jgi:hypothetical protein
MHTPIERAPTLDGGVFKDHHVAGRVPVIVTGHSAIRDAATRWSLDHLVERHPDHKVSVEFYEDGNRNRPWVYRSMTLGEYVSLIRQPGERARYYLAEKPLKDVLPNLAQDVPPPDFLREVAEKTRPVVFLGIDTYTGAHYHFAPNEAVLMQIVGRKKVVLCPAEQYRSFYPRPWFLKRSNWSRAPMNPGGAQGAWMPEDTGGRFPRLRTAPALECVLALGELLVVPRGWFHIAYGLGESLSVTHFWDGSWRNAYWKIALRDALTAAQKASVEKVRGIVKRVRRSTDEVGESRRLA